MLSVREGADEVGGEEIRRELDSFELALDDSSDCVAEQGFCEPRDTFEEDVTACEQGDDGGVYHVILADDDACDFGFHGGYETGVSLNGTD